MAIELRKLRITDASELARMANNRKIWKNLRDLFPHPYHKSDALKFINKIVNDDPALNFGIICSGQLAGVIGLVPQTDVYKKSAELGFWLGEEYWGKGIATKAVGLITRYAFDDLGVVRIYSGVFDSNKGSIRVLEKNGFLKEGILKKAVFKDGKFQDEIRYAKVI